jgi:hypothetical protein
MQDDRATNEIQRMMGEMGARARAAAQELAYVSQERKYAALISAANLVWDRRQAIFDANCEDLAAGEAKGLSSAMMDRLKLDDGRLSDNRGQLASFANTVIILTSNVGAVRILEATERGTSDEDLREEVQQELKKHFRPEFLNRIDDVCIFDRLSKVALRGIVDIQLKRLGKLLSENRIRLDVTPGAKDLLTDLGYDPAFGARPLKRVILKQLQDPLAEELLRGGYKPNDTVRVDVGQEGFAFTKQS